MSIMASEPRTIIIKSVNWVGDAVLTTPAVYALKERFPEARIVMVARPWVAGVFRANPAISDLWVVNEKAHWKAYVNLIRRIRRMRFDLGVCFPNSFSAAMLLWAGGVRRRMGYRRDARAMLLNASVAVTPDILAKRQVEYYLNILRDVVDLNTASRKLRLYPEIRECEEMDAFLLSLGVGPRDFLVGLNPGAFFGSAKRWLPDRFGLAAAHLIQHYGAKVAVLGTERETPIAADVQRHCPHPLLDLTGRLTLRQLIALIRRTNFFLTNDSGAMHIAAAFDIPMVAIFGSTDWRTTPPHSDAAVIVRRDDVDCAPCMLRECPIDHRCMTRISVEDVCRAIDEQIERCGVKTPYRPFAPAAATAEPGTLPVP
ncbi:MAG: lipopolysaccharide heptosyltransferase II [Candidatus Sumerlaeia bacterium]